ncbi:MAG TPA: cytochrome c3 family protein [Hyphomicrobiales bacterium]|nr:cytochrome c3 family protein [Hyphomicrobiales bacterium]
MAQIFRPRADAFARVLLAAVLVLPLALIGFVYVIHTTPYTTGEGFVVNQPVPFSHLHHVGEDGIDCRYCHTSVEQGRFAGMPTTHVCMTCHSQLWTNAAMLAPVRQSLAEDKPIRWNRVYKLPDYVYFDHSVHVKNGIGCSSCHGRIDEMPLTRQAAPLTMRWCIACHRHPERALRPPDQVFSMTWTPPKDQLAEGRKLLAAYLIHKDHLTDCSVCHR